MVGKGFPSQGSPSLSSVTQESPRRECILKGNDVGGRRVSQESPGLGSRPRRDDSRSLPKPSASAAALTGESPAQLGGGPMDPRRFRSSLVPGTQLRKTWFLPSKDVQPRKRLLVPESPYSYLHTGDKIVSDKAARRKQGTTPHSQAPVHTGVQNMPPLPRGRSSDPSSSSCTPSISFTGRGGCLGVDVSPNFRKKP